MSSGSGVFLHPTHQKKKMKAELEAHIKSLPCVCVTLNILSLRSLHREYDRF